MKLVWMHGCMDGKEKGERRKIGGTPGCRFFNFFGSSFPSSWFVGRGWTEGKRKSVQWDFAFRRERKVDSVSGDGNENFI